MLKRIGKNQKGAVLLTVICFTTMCMIIAAVALKIANRADVRSNENVRRAQAQITAEHYLEQYLSTFKSDPVTNRINFEKLNTIAGANESAARKITISLTPSSGGGATANISTDDFDKSAVYGGNCSLYVYREGSNGIVVKAMAEYGDQTGLASAYFYQDSPVIDLNKNAVETVNFFTGTDYAVPVIGDVMLEVNLNDPGNKLIWNHNSTGDYHSNVYVNTNYMIGKGTTLVDFHDTIQGYAPTITTLGHLFLVSGTITTDVGKSDENGLKNGEIKKDDSGKAITDKDGNTINYNPDALLNKNGYLNVDKKLFVAGMNGNESKIGSASTSTTSKDIDVYCCGGVFGNLPDTSYRLLSGATSKPVAKVEEEPTYYNNWKSEITNDYGYSTGGRSGTGDIYGSVFCRQKSADNIDADGTLIFNTAGGGGAVTIHGDLLVEGDLILYTPVKVTGSIYCDNIIDCGGASGSSAKNYSPDKWTKLSPSALNTPRSKTPKLDYAPGLYDPKTRPNPVLTHTVSYQTKTPNNMYAQNDKKTKFMATNFANALKYTLDSNLEDGTPVSDYSGNFNSKITINSSCRLTKAQVTNSQAKYFVNVQDEDIWLLLPVTSGASSTQMQCKIISNNKAGGKHHCYVCFYNDADLSATVPVQTVFHDDKGYFKKGDPEWTAENNWSGAPKRLPATEAEYNEEQAVINAALGKLDPKKPEVIEKAAKYYLSSNSESVTFYIDNTVAMASSKLTTDFNKQISKDTIGNYTGDNPLTTNLLVLIPDGFDMKLYNNGTYNAIFYGPKAKLTLHTQSGATLIGQAKVDHFDATNDTSHAVAYNDITEDSILHSFLTDAANNSGSVFFQYYVRHQ